MKPIGSLILFLLLLSTAYAQDVPSIVEELTACDPASPLAHGAPSNSPTGQFIVFFECYEPGKTPYTVYVYDIEREETFSLGKTADDLTLQSIYVSHWLTDTLISIRSETGGGTYNWRSVYVGDVTELNSLTEVARDYVASPRFGIRPQRYEWAIEDGDTQQFAVYSYDVMTQVTTILFEAPCDMRDETSCHMVTPESNADFVEDGIPTYLILNKGDSAKETKDIVIQDLTTGETVFSQETLGGGYGNWLSADTAAIFQISFDLDKAAFEGLFVQIDENGIAAQETFLRAINSDTINAPSWLESP